MIVKNLNPFMLSLSGTKLIEASAGTGKTYTIVLLYLRLLLGLDNKLKNIKPLQIQEILVVTFTESSTLELRNRIRENIYKLRMACINGSSTNSMLQGFLNQIDNFKDAESHLLLAERKIDEAAIYTIHGFCLRILNQNSIESNINFKKTLIENESLIYEQVTLDFWRRYFSTLPLNIANIINTYWSGPKKFLIELTSYIYSDIKLINNSFNKKYSIIEKHKKIIEYIKNFKFIWAKKLKNIILVINCKNINITNNDKKKLLKWINKINFWINEKTVNYHLPKELIKYEILISTKKIFTNYKFLYELCILIKSLYKKTFSLYNYIINIALIEIRKELKKEKDKRLEISFNDLINYLYESLHHKNEILSEYIRIRYPVAMIDEFQDTDLKQYNIFKKIYFNKLNCSLFLIGDPKQAIYSFRGANIFTYMQARNEINSKYTLNINWRSSKGIINSINKIFQRLSLPFIFKNIPFIPVLSSSNNSNCYFIFQNKIQSPMKIWLQKCTKTGLYNYKLCMAYQCALTINNWLNSAKLNESWLEREKKRKYLKASDIAILVRNKNEAILINEELNKFKISSVYLSNKKDVFKTSEAKEIYYILKAILFPEKISFLRTALSTRMLGFDSKYIYTLNNNKILLDKIVKNFFKYKIFWKKHNVFLVLRKIIIKYNIAENLLASQNGKQRLTNILHIRELLQKESIKFNSNYQIIKWLSLQIKNKNLNIKNYLLRIESDKNLVKIITIHKSKGLEFPIVIIPFAASFYIEKKKSTNNFFKNELTLNIKSKKDNLQSIEQNRLSEDIRLLYVALTRSIYHCILGIAPLFYNKKKKNNISDFHLSAIGYLIQKGKNLTTEELKNNILELIKDSQGDIELNEISKKSIKPILILPKPNFLLKSKNWPNIISDSWKITSYTDLLISNEFNITKKKQEINIKEIFKHKNIKLTQHTFSRGKNIGIFFHKIFETLNFNKPLNLTWLNEKLIQYNIDSIWLKPISNWIFNIIFSSLDEKSLSLSKLSNNNKISEFAFYLSINSLVTSKDLNDICIKYDPISAKCSKLNFPKIKGILKGFIDLVFRWNNRYYLIDYKSNWLGKNSSFYTNKMMENNIINNRYDLQYQIYTLVLHRFLKSKLLNYDYQVNFGGIYYLFLRGIDPNYPKNGIFYVKPKNELINNIDKLFTKEIN